jgi:hypothetical protein
MGQVVPHALFCLAKYCGGLSRNDLTTGCFPNDVTTQLKYSVQKTNHIIISSDKPSKGNRKLQVIDSQSAGHDE